MPPAASHSPCMFRSCKEVVDPRNRNRVELFPLVTLWRRTMSHVLALKEDKNLPYYTTIAIHVPFTKSSPIVPSLPPCRLSIATLPLSSPRPPFPGLKPYNIVIGRGTQSDLTRAPQKTFGALAIPYINHAASH